MKKLFSVIFFILRFAFCLTFILSGTLKMTDPVGTGLIVTEYLKTFGIDFLLPYANATGIILSAAETVVGIAVLARLRMSVFTTIGLLMTLFFTAITVYLYLYNPLDDCGCFGRAIHLTNGETLAKNIFLLICIIPVFLYRNHFDPVTLPPIEWATCIYYTLLVFTFAIIALKTNPYIEFGDFQTDTNLLLLRDGAIQTDSTSSTPSYIYEKDGIQQTFSLDEIPDTTWTYVGTEDKGSTTDEGVSDAASFEISDRDGNYITDTLLRSERKIVLFPVHHPEDISRKEAVKLASAAEGVHVSGFQPLILFPSPKSESGDSLTTVITTLAPALEDDVAYSDFKTLISLSRSNGGAVYLYRGVIIQKYHHGTSTKKLLKALRRDYDEEAAAASIRQSLILEGSIVFILLNIILFRYICDIIHDGELTMADIRARRERRRERRRENRRG